MARVNVDPSSPFSAAINIHPCVFFFLPCPDFIRILIDMCRGFIESLEIVRHCIDISFRRSTGVMNGMPNRSTYLEELVAKLLPWTADRPLLTATD